MKGLESMTANRGGGDAVGLFRLSRRQGLALGGMFVVALGAALYLRYGVVENTALGLACDAGVMSVLCRLRSATIYLFNSHVFGAVAIAAACLQLCRPNIIAFGIGLVFAAFGVVLYNTRLSALAVAFLVFSLARLARGGMRAKAE
jgi:hypothetical protein